VKEEEREEWDDYEGWQLMPLRGATLASEYVQGPFQGLFILQGQIVSQDGEVEHCYLDVVLPERICEHRYVLSNSSIARVRGRKTGSGTAIPSVAIEKFGVPQLYYARENPSAGINMLQNALHEAAEKKYVAYDLGVLLRIEKRYEEAIKAFSIFLEEDPQAEIARSIYQERSQLYRITGQHEKAEEDRRLWAFAFERAHGRPPTPEESF
jgi:tetratricopeptide (TPR) repeat protein